MIRACMKLHLNYPECNTTIQSTSEYLSENITDTLGYITVNWGIKNLPGSLNCVKAYLLLSVIHRENQYSDLMIRFHKNPNALTQTQIVRRVEILLPIQNCKKEPTYFAQYHLVQDRGFRIFENLVKLTELLQVFASSYPYAILCTWPLDPTFKNIHMHA